MTIAVVPRGTTVAQLAGVGGMGVGIMGAGIGPVPAEQTYLDAGQGNRIASALYDDPLPPLMDWTAVRKRATDAPADIVPGLLGSTLAGAGVPVHASGGSGDAAAMVFDEAGHVSETRRCRQGACPGVGVVAADVGKLRRLAGRLRGDDLLISIERPPPAANRELAFGIAGTGFDGTLTSDSTRMRGYVVSTDVAPTILARLGIAVPHQMDGEPIHTDGSVDGSAVQSLEDRLAAIGPRRGPVIGASLLIWIGLCALAGLTLRMRGLRVALPVLAVGIAYLPAVLLLTGALEPSESAERLIAGLGSPLLALLTLRLAPPFGALAIAAAVSVIGYGVDVVAGSHLTELSLMGPDPAEGVRFFGIGNELEAAVSALVPIATGAALVTWAPRASVRSAVVAFVATALLAVAAFAPGRFGADVGAAIGIPVGAAVAAGVCLAPGASGSPWRVRAALVIAAPLFAVAALVAVDLLLGGNAHLTRSVLRVGGLNELGYVLERRLRLSANSFSRYADTAKFWVAVAGLVAGFVGRRRIRSWFGERRLAWAGLLGALGATAAGTLANDSGALLLIIGTLVLASPVAVAWATHERRLFSRSRVRDGVR